VKLAGHDQATIDAKLRENVLTFYKDRNLPFATRKDPKEWQQTLAAIDKLSATTVASH